VLGFANWSHPIPEIQKDGLKHAGSPNEFSMGIEIILASHLYGFSFGK